MVQKNKSISIKIPENDKRTPEQILEHYKIEKELANRLRNSTRDQRRYLYVNLYNELFERVKSHPMLVRKNDFNLQQANVVGQIRNLKQFLNKDTVFLEIGSGDCSLSSAVSNYVKKVYAVDVSIKITDSNNYPPNFELIISDGCSIPVPNNSINVAYSNQLMEHLHPDDAYEQLQNVYRVLSYGGKYICITPNRLLGPHDVSKYFDKIATGFHLKEYTSTDVHSLFRKVGFSKIDIYTQKKDPIKKLSSSLIIGCEKCLEAAPFYLRKMIVKLNLFKILLCTIVVGKK